MRPTPRLLLAAACALVALGTAGSVRAESPGGWHGGDRWQQQDRRDGGGGRIERRANREAWHGGWGGRGWDDRGWAGRDWRPRGEDGGRDRYAPPPRAYRSPGRS